MSYSVSDTQTMTCVLNLPKPRTNYLKRSDAILWNSLPESIRAIKLIGQFKKEINSALETSDSHSAFL